MKLDDLKARLRDEGALNGGNGAYAWKARELCTKAAAAITDLEALVGELGEALGIWSERYKAVPEWRLRPTSDDQPFVQALLLTRATLAKLEKARG